MFAVAEHHNEVEKSRGNYDPFTYQYLAKNIYIYIYIYSHIVWNKVHIKSGGEEHKSPSRPSTSQRWWSSLLDSLSNLLSASLLPPYLQTQSGMCLPHWTASRFPDGEGGRCAFATSGTCCGLTAPPLSLLPWFSCQWWWCLLKLQSSCLSCSSITLALRPQTESI